MEGKMANLERGRKLVVALVIGGVGKRSGTAASSGAQFSTHFWFCFHLRRK
jgi:hypothetical protein